MWHRLIQNKEQSSARLAEKAAKKKLAMASGKSTIKPSKKSTAMQVFASSHVWLCCTIAISREEEIEDSLTWFSYYCVTGKRNNVCTI